jgi:hypothetical protein
MACRINGPGKMLSWNFLRASSVGDSAVPVGEPQMATGDKTPPESQVKKRV